jgi:hypothetical protein
MARPAGDIGAAKADRSARRAMHAGDRADQRRLAGTVRPHNGDDRAFVDGERDAVERLGVAVEHVEVFDREHAYSASAPR